jgi:hypothetical protein
VSRGLEVNARERGVKWHRPILPNFFTSRIPQRIRLLQWIAGRQTAEMRPEIDFSLACQRRRSCSRLRDSAASRGGSIR